MTPWIWIAGAALLLAAGFTAGAVPRLQARRRTRDTAWTAARAAIAVAEISRDAARRPVPEADDLLARAIALTVADADPDEATRQARAADDLWRAATDA